MLGLKPDKKLNYWEDESDEEVEGADDTDRWLGEPRETEEMSLQFTVESSETGGLELNISSALLLSVLSMKKKVAGGVGEIKKEAEVNENQEGAFEVPESWV